MGKVEYGKIINGRFFAAPRKIIEGDRVLFNPPGDMLEKRGYKRVIFLDSIENSSEKNLRLVWEETDDAIIQKAVYDEFDNDYVIQFQGSYGKSKGLFDSAIKRRIEEINDYQRIQFEKMLRDFPMANLYYEHARKFFPDKSIKEIIPIMQERTIRTPVNDLETYVSQIPTMLQEKGSDFEIPFLYSAPFSHLEQKINEYEKNNYRMVFCYLHTVFDDFLAQVIRLIVSLHPLGANLPANISTEELFRAENIDQLKDEIINKKIDSIGHESYQSKIEFLEKRGIQSTLPREEYWDDMILFCETRNVLIHNGGFINKIFLQKVSGTKHQSLYSIGDEVEISYEAMQKSLDKITCLCADLYAVIQQKFHI